MIRFLLLISLVICAWASPAPPVELSIFDDDSIPWVEESDLDVFNLSALPRDLGIEKRALNLDYTLYDITLDGRNKGNWQPFVVSGTLLIIKRIPSPGTRNGPNMVDVVIKVGSPVGNPIAGNVQYVTNRYLNPLLGGLRDSTGLDFAYVSNTATTVKVTVDSSLAASNQISVFNARSGLLANVYNPATGGFSLTVTNGKISGRIDFVGRPLISDGYAPYHATFSGKAVKKSKITF